ncbi:MAG: nitronate monooxygenase [Gammaproteobacteria bacterium]|nr:nitronate monooxygenase [Gammaproteobacteria bacterium]
MFLVSGPQLVIAACRAGLPASFPTLNARPESVLEAWLDEISSTLATCKDAAPWIPNLILHPSNPRATTDVEIVLRYRPEIVITALGKPGAVAERVHQYGGLVFADVNSIRFARVAAANGADGLVLVCAGAGGHTGFLSPFAFVSAVRQFFDGPLVVAGGLMTGRDVRAIEVMGADFAYMGTRFIATPESLASDAYRQMLVDATAEDIVLSDKFTGVPANYLRPSIAAAGIDLATFERRASVSIDQRNESKAWRDIWSAGHGVGAITRTEPVTDVVARLRAEYTAAR